MASPSEDQPTADLDRQPAFRDIFESEYAYVRTSARRLGIIGNDLDDVVHDIFLTVHRKLADFDPSRPIRPWLFGIAFRVAVGHKRRFRYAREKLSSEKVTDFPDERPGADQQIETEERRQMVHEALDRLDDDKRAIFILHELDGVLMAEVASMMGIPINTAYSRLRLARIEFRQALERIALRDARTRGGPS